MNIQAQYQLWSSDALSADKTQQVPPIWLQLVINGPPDSSRVHTDSQVRTATDVTLDSETLLLMHQHTRTQTGTHFPPDSLRLAQLPQPPWNEHNEIWTGHRLRRWTQHFQPSSCSAWTRTSCQLFSGSNVSSGIAAVVIVTQLCFVLCWSNEGNTPGIGWGHVWLCESAEVRLSPGVECFIVFLTRFALHSQRHSADQVTHTQVW